MLNEYAHHCGAKFFREATPFERRLVDFFVHYDPDRIYAVGSFSAQFTQEQLIEQVRRGWCWCW
jgi:hypothetical protein